MKYMLLIHGNEQFWGTISRAEQSQIMAEFGAFTEQVKTRGQYVSGAQLQPTSTATSVRIRDGKRLVTDGPFAETQEQLGGYYLIDAKDLDEAIAVAAQIPSVRYGTVEVRPIVPMPVPAAS